MTHGRSEPRCRSCDVVGFPTCERCGGTVVGRTGWVHAHDPPGWWHASCWAARMRELDLFTGGIT